MTRARRLLSGLIGFGFAASAALAPSGSPSANATTWHFPSARLLAAQSEITVVRFKGEPAPLDLGVYVASMGGAFEVQVKRDGYTKPITVWQVARSSGTTLVRELPATLADGWVGLKKFLRITAVDANGTVVAHRSIDLCPDTFDPQRVSDDGPQLPTYPQYCGANPFTLGSVWGIDKGWAVAPFEYGSGGSIKVPDGHYEVTVAIAPADATLFAIPPANASVTVGMTVKTQTGKTCPPFCAAAATSGPAAGSPPNGIPIVTNPDPKALPDLIPLPAWGIDTHSSKTHDFLDFGATVWDAGPAPLIVEGFRRLGTDVMDAFEYFSLDGKVVGRSPAGTLVYDSAPGHEHWHFEQFARYRLLDGSKTAIVRSTKTGFCIAPTDSIDLTVKGATWRPESIGLFSACGDATSIWTRETMPTGWGDTYFQYLPGQSFNITDLPNGTYFISVEANPTGLLHERNSTNDTRLRKVILGGVPGARTVKVPPWNGIDSEAG